MVAIPRIKDRFQLAMLELGLDVVCLMACLGIFSSWKSTMRRGLPVFFAQTTILWYGVTGMPIGTGSITPSAHIHVEPGLDFLLPVQWQWNGDMEGHRFYVGVNHKFHERAIMGRG